MKHLPLLLASIALAGAVVAGVLLGLLYRQVGQIEQRLTSLTLGVARAGGASLVLPLPTQAVQVDFPWTDDHEDALHIFTGRKIPSVLLLLADGPKTVAEIAESLPSPDDDDRDYVHLLADRLRLIRTVAGDFNVFELSDRGRRIVAAWRQIPEEIVDTAMRRRWQRPDVTPTPTPQP